VVTRNLGTIEGVNRGSQTPIYRIFGAVVEFGKHDGANRLHGWGRIHSHSRLLDMFSASARISKGQGYQGLRKKAGSSFGQKRKNRQNFTPLIGSIKCFPIKF
jgi:hypothetical protein